MYEKNTRNELARLVMGTMFLVILFSSTTHNRNLMWDINSYSLDLHLEKYYKINKIKIFRHLKINRMTK